MTTTAAVRAPLERPRDVVLSGVSVAVSRHLRIPVSGVRIGFAGLTLIGGAGALLYLWLWALVPLERARVDLAGVTRSVPVAIVLLALQAAAAGTAVFLNATGFQGPL